ncbi:hypothetical protein PYH37_000355 [Sinorhizobium numidicum]|uniref:Uncharacterized protein n=1 Tax=Sinorhizobium numidicum TaxID=680248 RepID=A0ABY8CQU7_9HYPH|nr:hypothetical protein [Sinorhizobium numidicum]WEX75026.1 hypothetical protein PYH37_000355 [Sinorhizobium numidicum]WEX81020.1 hypothetical protein PYH38_000357 [Sinorhizobium numidicum]
MGLVTLVLTVCLISAPERCREENLQFQGHSSLTQCMFQSVIYIAKWSEEHPALRVKRWRCKLQDAGRLI